MPLKDWLEKTNWSNRNLGEYLGCSEECARLYRHGKRRPKYENAQKIVLLTKGSVTFEDLEQAYAHQKEAASGQRELNYWN
jgi:hypothetical protein